LNPGIALREALIGSKISTEAVDNFWIRQLDIKKYAPDRAWVFD
jgi:hypothetical protein